MADHDSWQPGQFCWLELGTTDIDSAKSFYGELFGWGFEDVPISDGEVYRMPSIRGRHVAGMYKFGPQQLQQGVPPNWLPYVAVEEASAAAERARSLGATVHFGPMDVFDVGRMVVLQDPTGAYVSLWEPKKHKGYEVFGEHGAVCWLELVTRDVEGAKRFYSGMFGWDPRTMESGDMPYYLWHQGDKGIGGMMEMLPDMGKVPPHWMTYFAVNDCDAIVEKAKELGGGVIMPGMDIPEVGRFAILHDREGAVFSVIKPNAM